MASQTISGAPWADGTSVSVYLAAGWVNRSQVPSGTAVATASVSGGAVTFSGLAESVRYVAYAAGKGVTFVVPQMSPMDARSLRVRLDELEGDTLPTVQARAADLVFNVKAYGAVGDGVTDDRAAIQAAVTACENAGGGTVYIPPGLYLLNSNGAILLSPNNAGTRGWVRIEHAPGALFKLGSTACQGGYWFHRVADYDMFRKIAIIRPVIDANNIGNASSVIGSQEFGTIAQRVSFEDILIEDAHIYNLPSLLPTNQRTGIYLASNQPGTAPSYPETVQQTVKRIWIVRPKVYGGDLGVGIAATPSGASAPNGTNVYFDDIHVIDPIVELNAGAAPATYKTQSGVIIGGSGFGNKVRIRNSAIKYSADVAIEIDAMQDAVIENPYDENCKVGVYWNNYHPAEDVNTQRLLVRGARSKVTSAWTAGMAGGIATGTTNPLGRLQVRDQDYLSDGQLTSTMTIDRGMALNVLASVREVDVDGFKCRITGMVFDNAGAITISVLDLGATNAGAVISARNLDTYWAGNHTGAGAVNARVYAFHATDATLHLGPKVIWETNQSGTASAGTWHGVYLGESITGITTSIFRGGVQGLLPKAMVGDTAPKGIRLGTPASLGSITPTRFPITFSDFSLLSAAGLTTDDIVWPDNTVRGRLVLTGNWYRQGTAAARLHEVTGAWDPPSIVDGAAASTTLAFTGVGTTEQFAVAFSQVIPAGAFMVAQVSAADTVAVTLFNKTGGALDLASGTLRVMRLPAVA